MLRSRSGWSLWVCLWKILPSTLSKQSMWSTHQLREKSSTCDGASKDNVKYSYVENGSKGGMIHEVMCYTPSLLQYHSFVKQLLNPLKQTSCLCTWRSHFIDRNTFKCSSKLVEVQFKTKTTRMCLRFPAHEAVFDTKSQFFGKLERSTFRLQFLLV